MVEGRRVGAWGIGGLLVGIVLVMGYVLGPGGATPRGPDAGVRDVVVEHLEPEGRPELEPIVLSRSQQPEEVRARAQRMSKLARLIDVTSGDAIAGALFHARHEQRIHTANEEGEVPIPLSELPSGSTVVEFEAGADGYCVTRGELAKAELSSLHAHDIPLYKASPVHGVVFGVDGQPLRTVYVTVEETDTEDAPLERPRPEGFPADWRLAPEGIGGRVTSKEDGSFRLAGLVPNSGGYEVEFFRPGFHRKRVPVTTRGPGVVTLLEVVLERIPGPPRGIIAGMAYMNGELEGGRIHIRGHDLEGDPVEDQTHAEWAGEEKGAFRFEMPPGRYELSYIPYEWSSEDPEAASSRLQNHTVEVTVADGMTTRQDIRAEGEVGVISGRALDSRGQPLVQSPFLRSANFVLWPGCDGQGRFEVVVPADEVFEVTLGDIIGAPVIQGVEAGTTDLVLRMPELPGVQIQLIDEETRESILGYGGRVWMRPVGGLPWSEALTDEQDCHSVTECTYRCPKGLMEIRVHVLDGKRGRKRGLAQFEVVAGRRNLVLVEMKPRR